MQEIFNNPWVVGIGGGVFSGLFVAILTRAIFSRKDKREYVQKLQLANSEILYAIRPGIPEGKMPSESITNSLLLATARKYNVDTEDMLSTKEIAQELIKEVMDSSFISASSKCDFCDELSNFGTEKQDVLTDKIEPIREYEIMSRYRRQTVTILSMMVGLLTAVMGGLATLKIDNIKANKEMWVMLALPAFLSVFIAFALRILKDLKADKMNIRILGTELSFRSKKEKETEQN